MQKRETWPVVVTSRGVSVKIYRTIIGGAPRFQVASYLDGHRRLRTFSDFAAAQHFAREVADKLAAGEVSAARLTKGDAAALARAQELLRESGASIEVVAATFAECERLVGADNILTACREWKRNHQMIVRRPVADVVEEFLEKKSSKSIRYARDLRFRLVRFVDSFQCDLCDISTAQVQKWLDGLKLGPQSTKNFKTVVGTLFTFAVARGWAATNPVDGVEVESPRGGEIAIYRPEEFQKLLAAADPEFLPCLVLGGLVGIRTAEILRLDWADVRLDRRHIVISAGKAKTAARRIVPMGDALADWLRPYADRTGPVWPLNEGPFHLEQRRVATESGIAWKTNALRHSYASYRFAEIADAGRVASELGNSPAMIFRHYREMVTAEEAKEWFAIRPSP